MNIFNEKHCPTCGNRTTANFEKWFLKTIGLSFLIAIIGVIIIL